MALNVPENAVEVVNRAKVDVVRALPGVNPFLRNSWIGALVSAFGNRVFDLYFALQRAALEAIPDTAVLSLEQWAAIWDILRNPAVKATGRIALTGTATGAVVVGTPWVSSDGKQYLATTGGSIVLQSLTVASITRVGSVATLTTDNDHLIASNVLITITGALQTEYNITGPTCTVTGAKTLTFAVSATPATPATGGWASGAADGTLGVGAAAPARRSPRFGSVRPPLPAATAAVGPAAIGTGAVAITSSVAGTAAWSSRNWANRAMSAV